MGVYRFVGVECKIGDAELKTIGQKIELPDEQATDLIRHPRGAAIIPDDEFSAIGFTDAELQRYGRKGSQVNAPAEFKDKIEQARQVLVDLRQRYQEEIA
jgi:hypothetical protein